MERNTIKIQYVLVVVAFALAAFFSSYKLFASPETWMDEGLIVQSAQGLLETGKASLPVAPGVYEPAWYITTGFPLTLPLAGSFVFFGVSLESARLVMLAFLLLFFVSLFFFARNSIGGAASLFGFFLLVFFGPLYGNGRNVLGEVPGLLFMLVALLPLLRGGALSRNRALIVGAGAGLAVAAKPIFMLFIPALLLALLLRRRELRLEKVFVYGVLGAALPLFVWAVSQFGVVDIEHIFKVYANPHDLDIISSVRDNLKRVFIEAQPFYFFIALALWMSSYVVRKLKNETVSLAEEALLFFSTLIFFVYLRTAGYYRYFFPGQVFALLYLPQTLWYLAGKRSVLFPRAVAVLLCLLVLFQAYETVARSWTAVHYDSTRTETLKRYFTALPAEEEIFVYQAPEVVPFAVGHPVYQYVEITPSIRAGEEYKTLVLEGAVKTVITPENFFTAQSGTIFARYKIVERVDAYVVATSI